MKKSRCFAKTFDYALFYSFFYILDFSLLLNILLVVALPVLYAPIEALLLRLFKTTPGMWIFGLSLDTKVSFKKALLTSLKKGLLVFPLLFPPLNLFIARFYLKEKGAHFAKRWQVAEGVEIEKKKRNKHLRNLVVVLCSAFILYTFTPISFSSLSKRAFDVESWVEVKDDHLKFSVYFPEEPKISGKKVEVKEHNTTLDVKEYHHKSHINYKLQSTKVPTTWTLLGSRYLLNALGQQIETHQGSFIESKIGKHGKYPALHYLVKNHDGGQTKGALILVKKTVYRLEVSAGKKLSKEELEISQNFIDSFSQN